MKDKIMHAFTAALMIVLPVAIWYASDIAEWLLGVPPRPTKDPMFTLPHIWGTQIAVTILCGAIWPVSIPATEKQLQVGWWLRSFVLALVGGIIGSLFLKPYAWWIAPLLAIFGLVQMSLVGTVLGTHLRNPNLQKRVA